MTDKDKVPTDELDESFDDEYVDDDDEYVDDDDEYVDEYAEDEHPGNVDKSHEDENKSPDSKIDDINQNSADSGAEKNGANGHSRKEKRKERIEKIKAFFKNVLKAFDDALYPLDCTCDVCGEELVEKTRYRLCSDCIENLPFAKGHICLNCGMPLDDESDYCNRCQNQKSAFVKNRSPLVYDGEVKKLIYKFKFSRKKYIAQTLGALMADKYLESGMDSEIIVYVPMTDAEVKKRGFNQAELLAYEVGGRLDIPVLGALVKIKDTSQQKELKGKDRAVNLEGAFACLFEQVKGRKILLVDDIFTTGATANECANTLLKAKAREVCVLTAAVTKLKIPGE